MKKNIHYTNDQQAAVNRLHLLLAAIGVDTTDPKRGGFSDSALFRYLVNERLKELETDEKTDR